MNDGNDLAASSEHLRRVAADVGAVRDRVTNAEQAIRNRLVPSSGSLGDVVGFDSTGAPVLVQQAAANGSVLTSDTTQSSGIRWQAPQIVRATKNATQSLASTTDTVITFPGADTFDTNAMHDPVTNNTRLTAKVAGYYLVIAKIHYAAHGTGYRFAYLQKNGAGTYALVVVAAVVGGASTQFIVSDTIDMAANDYIELRSEQSSGVALNVDTGTTFGMHLVAAT